MKRIAIIMVAALAVALGLGIAIADPQDAQSTVGATGAYTVTAANSVSTQGGNVTAVDVASDQSTQKWQGFWGNVSGSLRLGDGADVFYDWSSVTFQAVYASPDNAVDWSTPPLDLTGAGAMNTKDTEYGFTSTDPDSITNTFSGGACSAGTIFTAADGVFSYNSVGGNSAWETCIGQDAAGVANTVFGTDVVAAGSDGYNGQNIQYQLMVPVNASGQLYYFYLEI